MLAIESLGHILNVMEDIMKDPIDRFDFKQFEYDAGGLCPGRTGVRLLDTITGEMYEYRTDPHATLASPPIARWTQIREATKR